MINREKYIFLLMAISLPGTALAHHSRVQYDQTKYVELSGEIVKMRWRNPHIVYHMRVTNENGEDETWMLEAGSIYMLARTGVRENPLSIGDQVRVAGYASKNGDPEFYLQNVMLPNGQEVALVPGAEPYWSDDVVGGRHQWSSASVANGSGTQGIFRVWSRENISGQTTGTDQDNLPLTATAREKQARFDPLEDDPMLDCIQPGMPRSMGGPHPIQFIDHGDTIEIQNAEMDIRRTVYMTGDAIRDPQDMPFSKQGYSHGTWQGDVLEVRTTRVDWPFFDGVGTPLSTQAEILERFTVSDDDKRLDSETVVTDPVTFTEPVIVGRYWVDIGEPMEIYNCVVE
jgi:hypothetical protein